jgi:thiamine kinase-like enzyme
MNTPPEPEILAALEQAGICPRSFARISNLYSTSSERCTYRIEHERGTVKVRRVEDEATARDLAAFISELPEGFTAVIARHGRVLIEDWIEGEALPDVPGPHHLAAAGALLAELHAKPRLGDCYLHDECPTAYHHRLAQERLRIVAEAGALKEEDVVRLERALERWDPVWAIYGLTHLDFCGENMVIDRTGKLRVVDNDRVRLDALGFDLARTWYRWARPAPEWEAFCLAYTSRLPFPSSLAALRFWKITAAAQSAELRLRAYPEKAGVPINCLRALAAEETV